MQSILDILGSIGFNWHVALANFINFLIILFLLNKFFFGKLGKTIQNRQEIIERGLSQASDAEKALASAHDEKKKIIKDARKEGQDIVAKAEQNATDLAESIASQADAEAARRMHILDEKEAAVQETVEKEFALRAPKLVAQMYAKTLAREMTEADNNALISRMNA
jgi:F-type H+-transporting ATPase subunit b